MIEESEPILEEDKGGVNETAVDEPENPEIAVDGPESPETAQDDDNDEEDRIVTFGEPEEEEEKEPEAPGWVKTVRRVNRKLESENKRLKRELQQRSTEETKKPPIELGEKPTLKSAGYDEAKFETELQAWYDRKKQIDLQQAEEKKVQEAQARMYQERASRYFSKKEEHGFKDFSESEDMVIGTLNAIQQSVIIHGADDSALVVYALGKNPKKLEELSKIQDPVKFAMEIGKLEPTLTVKSKKAPAPEKRVESAKSGGLSGTADETLERLREEAAKTGNYTKVAAYKREKRSK